MPSPSDATVSLGNLGVSEADLLGALTLRDRAALRQGAVGGDDVWFEFVTMDDDRVRPAHAALHGTVWRVGDPAAPVPPLSWNCRCGMRYVAPPGTVAAGVLPTAEASPKPHAVILRDWLSNRFGMTPAKLDAFAAKLNRLPLADQQGAATLAVQAHLAEMGEKATLTESRALGNMVLSINKPRPVER